MRVVVDGVVYGNQKFGGINTYFNEILPRLAQQHAVQVDLLVPNKCRAQLPFGGVRYRRREFSLYTTGLSWKLDHLIIGKIQKALNAALRTAQLKLGTSCVFQSTYFTWIDDDIPQIATAYDMNHELLPDLYQDRWGTWLKNQYREYIRRATRILAISEKTKKDIIDIYGIDAGIIDVVHLAANRAAFHPNATESMKLPLQGICSDERPYILYVGGRYTYKNFAYVLKALVRLKEFELVVAGEPWNNEERKLIESFKLGKRVHLVVHPDCEFLRALYCNCNVFVFPSLHEGFGIPLLEAMSCGAVVLASNTEIFREVAGSAAMYFDPTEPDSLCSAITAVQSRDVRKHVINLGFQRSGEFSWDRCAKETLAVYEKAVAA